MEIGRRWELFGVTESPNLQIVWKARHNKAFLLLEPGSVDPNETKIEIIDNKHSRWVWSKMKDGYTGKNLIPAVKCYEGSVIPSGCFYSKSPGNLDRIHGIIDSIK